MIGRFVDNFFILFRDFKLSNLYNNKFYKISKNEIFFYKGAFILERKFKVIKYLNRIKKNNFEKGVITKFINKKSLKNDLIYKSKRSFIFLLRRDFNFKCKKFVSKFESIKDVEKFFHSFLEDVNNKEEIRLVFGELFFNAYEHGNLGLSFEEKSFLIKNGKYLDFVKKGNNKEIEVCVDIFEYNKKRYLICKITDEGKGFDLNKTFKSKYNGRGIMISDKICDAIFYNEKGNSVVFIKEII